jgi:hypothetical protein
MGLAKVERELAARGEGCLGRAADDEPVFVLRAQDKLADQLVDSWADLVELGRGPSAKVVEARELAEAMRAWPSRKFPD